MLRTSPKESPLCGKISSTATLTETGNNFSDAHFLWLPRMCKDWRTSVLEADLVERWDTSTEKGKSFTNTAPTNADVSELSKTRLSGSTLVSRIKNPSHLPPSKRCI